MSMLMEHPIIVGYIILLMIFYSMNYTVEDCRSKLGLVTVNTMIADTQIWNLVTSHFYEEKITKVLVDIGGLILIARSCKIRAGLQVALYIVLNILASSLFTSAYCFIRYFSTGSEEMIMAPIYGFSGVYMAILMLTRQQLRHKPIMKLIPNVSYSNLPVLLIMTQMILWLVGFKTYALDLPFSIIAMFFSWSYLRFFYCFEALNSSEGAVFGDNSEEFAFVGMFPEVSNAQHTLCQNGP